uniref:procollagen-lysine 5-dioxygenase n=1 Tax=Syphacia muris TaxID=451379 RepID=A0A0N5AT88_9BILA
MEIYQFLIGIFITIYGFNFAVTSENNGKPSLLVVTVATNETDGLLRLKRSAQAFGIKLNVFGLGKKWNGGDVRNKPGGGQKIQILKENLKKYKGHHDLIIMFVDAYDVILNSDEEHIVNVFMQQFKEYRVVFGAESFCWPDEDLSTSYPVIKFGKRYLNSGMFMGYAQEIWELINLIPVEDSDDDQLYYTKIYLNRNYRSKLEIGLDSLSHIFQNLNGAVEDVALEFTSTGKATLHSIPYATHPAVIHGNGPSKIALNHFGNYLGKAWTENEQCLLCAVSDGGLLQDTDRKNWPTITIALFIAKPIPFIKEFLRSVDLLDYPSSLVHLMVYNNQKYNEDDVNSFVKNARSKYSSVHIENADTEISEREARTHALTEAKQIGSEYLFMLDGDVHLIDTTVLRSLVQTAKQKRLGLLTPLVAQQGKFFSNFWGAVAEDGFYARSDDYLEIVSRTKKGIWNVPFISGAILINSGKFDQLQNAFSYNMNRDPDMSFCEFNRNFGHFMYVDNQQFYGFLVVSETFDTKRLHPEIYQIFENRELWESRYLNEKYFAVLNGTEAIIQPCPDVFVFPFLSETFCKQLVEEVEFYGKWSDGSHYDNRLVGGYENVPTRDIHMKQIDFERHWLHILDEYVRPVQETIYVGYYHKPVEAYMMFVVRYKPDEQPSLQPHHDASTYSVDIPLNKRGVDFHGGGVKFTRYNCTVDADEVGYPLMFPGRLTHLHEGLPTTSGTRYIAVSFVNP